MASGIALKATPTLTAVYVMSLHNTPYIKKRPGWARCGNRKR